MRIQSESLVFSVEGDGLFARTSDGGIALFTAESGWSAPTLVAPPRGHTIHAAGRSSGRTILVTHRGSTIHRVELTPGDRGLAAVEELRVTGTPPALDPCPLREAVVAWDAVCFTDAAACLHIARKGEIARPFAFALRAFAQVRTAAGNWRPFLVSDEPQPRASRLHLFLVGPLDKPVEELENHEIAWGTIGPKRLPESALAAPTLVNQEANTAYFVREGLYRVQHTELSDLHPPEHDVALTPGDRPFALLSERHVVQPEFARAAPPLTIEKFVPTLLLVDVSRRRVEAIALDGVRIRVLEVGAPIVRAFATEEGRVLAVVTERDELVIAAMSNGGVFAQHALGG